MGPFVDGQEKKSKDDGTQVLGKGSGGRKAGQLRRRRGSPGHKMRENATHGFEKEGVTGRRARGMGDGVPEWVLCGGFIAGAIVQTSGTWEGGLGGG